MARRTIPSEVRRRNRIRRRRMYVLAFAAVFVGILVNGYLSVRPEHVRTQVEHALRESLRGTIRLSKRIDVRWNLGVTLYHLQVFPPGEKPLEAVLEARRLSVRPRFLPLLLGRFELDDVVLDSPVVSVTRAEGGAWSVTEIFGHRLLEFFKGTPGAEDLVKGLPRIRVRKGTVHFRDYASGEIPARRDLLDISATLWGDSEGRSLRLEGSARSPFVELVDFRGKWTPSKGPLEVSLEARRLDVSAEVERHFGKQAYRWVHNLHLYGLADLKGSFRWNPAMGVVPVEVSGRLLQCSLSPPEIPFPLDKVSGEFTLKETVIQVRNLSGWLGAGPFRCSGVVEMAPGWREIAGYRLTASADAVPLDRRLLAWLPPRLATALEPFQFSGAAEIRSEVHSRRFPPKLEDMELRVSLKGLDFRYQGFPYPFSGLKGEIVVASGKVTTSRTRPLTAESGTVRLVASGWKELRPDGAMELDIRLEDLPLDTTLRNALPAAGWTYWDVFRPSGTVLLAISARRKAGGRLPEVVVSASARGVRILYDRFPYEVQGITGNFVMDLTRKRLTLTELRGYHGEHEITGKGFFDLEPGGTYLLELHASALTVDKDLKDALPPDGRRLLEDFRFRGRVGTSVKIYPNPGAGQTVVEVDLGLLEGEISYVLFPYPLKLGGGQLRAIGDHTFFFENWTTPQDSSPRVSFNGEIGIVGAERNFEFQFDLKGLTVDERLERALPEDLRRFVENFGLEGIFQGSVTGTFSYDRDQPSRNWVVYHAQDIQAREASVDFGIEMREIQGVGELAGGKDLEGNHYFNGGLKVHSAWFNRIHLEDAQIVYAFGREHPGVRLARHGKSMEGSGYVPGPDFLSRLSPGKVRETFQLQVLSSKLYGGKVQGFLFADVGERHDLAGEFSAEGIQVGLAAPDVFQIRATDIEGESRGNVAFSGKTGDARSLSGSGEGVIEKGKLINLPFFVGIVSLLFLQPSVNPHLEEVNIHFDIRDGKFWCPAPEGVAIRGDALNLNGYGTMDFDGKLDIVLTPSFLGFRIPVVDTVLDLLKKAVLQVWVQGSLENPEARVVSGAGLLRVPVGTRPKKPPRPLPRELLEKPKPEN